MSAQDRESAATAFFKSYPEFRDAMARSEAFGSVKEGSRLEVDGEQLYIVRGDSLGDEEDLYLDALIKGAAGQGELYRQLFDELDEVQQLLVRQRMKPR